MNDGNAKRRVAGVLGGMGPEATVGFMARVLALNPAETDQDHVSLLVDQNPAVPSRHAALLDGGESPGPALAAMAERLHVAGADFLVMPCNTAFAFADSIRTAVDVPLLSIVDVSLAACADHSTVGLMATRACLHADVYQEACRAKGITLVLPSADAIDRFMNALASIKRGDKGPLVSEAMASIAIGLADRGATTVIMGCTEIPLVLNQDQVDIPLVSSTDALAIETIALARGDKPLPTE